MPKYMIERNIPNVGLMPDGDVRNLSAKSNEVIAQLNDELKDSSLKDVQFVWRESFFSKDKSYCVYIAPNEEVIREHAKRGGFPCDIVAEIKRVIDPSTGE